MGMNRGKVLKAAKKKPVAKTRKVAAKRAPAKRKPAKKVVAKKAAAPPVKVVTRVETRTVEVDRNDKLRELGQRIIDATVANNDAAMLAFYADDIESKEPGMPASVGLDAIRQKFEMWRSMVSDATFLPRSLTADGKVITIEWEGTVTLAASGRVVEMPEIAVHEIANGRIVRERFYYDPALLQQQ
ncbi:MAG: nuclear transport factor 2 family protein [Candidatus Binatia bacterium]